MKILRNWLFYTKMIFDGRYYAMDHRALKDTYLIHNELFQLDICQTHTHDDLSKVCKSLHTLVIQPYQTLSLWQILKDQPTKDCTEEQLNFLASSIFKLCLQSPLTPLEVHYNKDKLLFKEGFYDLKFSNKTPYSFQLLVHISEQSLSLSLQSDHQFNCHYLTSNPFINTYIQRFRIAKKHPHLIHEEVYPLLNKNLSYSKVK